MENEKNQHLTHFLIALIAIVIILASLAVFIGTLYNIPLLTSILSSWINMKINTALCFLLTGISLLFIGKKYSVYITIPLSFVILSISGETIIEYLAHVDLGLDEFLIKDNVSHFLNTLFPGRMAFVTALNFMLVTFTLLLLHHSKFIWTIQTFAWLIILISLLSTFNYLYGANPNYIYAKYTTMAAPTMCLFILFSVAVLLKNPNFGIVSILLKKNTTGYLLRRVVPLSIIFILLLFQLELFLEKIQFVDFLGNLAITQTGAILIIGILIALTAIILDYKEKELEKSQSEILHNEMIFRQFAENIDIVFYTTSPDFSKILYVSPAYEAIWGKSTTSLYENPMDWFDSILPEDRHIAHEAFILGLQQKNKTLSAEYRIKRPDGSIRNIFSRIYLVSDESKNIFAIVGIAVDMTVIKLDIIYKQLQHDLITLIETEKNISHFSHTALKMIGYSLDIAFSAIWMIDETKNIMSCVDTWSKNTKISKDFELICREHTYSVGEDFPGKIWETKQATWVSDFSHNHAYIRSEAAKNSGINSVFGLPIIYQNKIFGVIEFFSHDTRKPDDLLLTIMESLGKSIGEFIVLNEAIKATDNIARYDFLTHVLNRPSLEQDLNALIATKKPTSIVIIVLDIDRFDLINKTFGHEYGDTLLQLIATRLNALTNHENAGLARLTADKFILSFPELDKAQAFHYAQSTKDTLCEPYELDNHNINLSVSIGIAFYPQDGLDGKSLFMNAELAMEQAKIRGGNKIIFFTKEMPSIISTEHFMELDLRQALISKQFILEYQPQISLKTGNICAAEALVRWQHPTRGLIYPKDFIFLASKSDLIISLNEYVLRMVFEHIHSNAIKIPISVNISSQQFADGFHFVEYLESLMNEFEITPKQIELEIVENMLIDDTEHNSAVITAIDKLGFQIAIDDFGTGFSSFNYLNRLPIKKIKIDRSFIAGLPNNIANVKIVKSIITLAHSLDKLVIAEGVETQAEIDFLKQEKCDIVQGFYYYKPMSLDALKDALK